MAPFRFIFFVVSLFMCFLMHSQNTHLISKADSTKYSNIIKLHLESACEIINLYGKKWNNPKVQLTAVTEGNWITIREKRRQTVSSRGYMAFNFNESTCFKKINFTDGGTTIEIEALFLKDGIQQKHSSIYRFIIEDYQAAEQLLKDFKTLKQIVDTSKIG